MFTTIISDCKGENERARQIVRFNSLGLGPVNLVGVGSDFSDDATIEGGANLVDLLDASCGGKGVIILNVAPRGNKKEGTNGNHFCFFRYKGALIISTTKGHCLSFVRKFNIAKQVRLVDVAEVLSFVHRKNLIGKELVSHITRSQFRSFEFVPRLARWLTNGLEVPSLSLTLGETEIPGCVWHIDAFGNAKLTLTSKNLNKKNGSSEVRTNLGNFKYYRSLKDIPLGETAIYTGSSGIGNERFLELATQGVAGSVAGKLDIKIGDDVKIL